MSDFNSLGLSQPLLDAIRDLGYTEMTGIQEKIIPLIMDKLDVIGQSSTGTGKTAAFAIPLIDALEPSEDGSPRILIMAPTRELAMQIGGEIEKIAKYRPEISGAVVYGGASITVQSHELKKADVVTGTPGRLLDLIHRGILELGSIKTVVLDEADEMLDMGFLDDIKRILRYCPKNRQTLLFSATIPSDILRISQQFQRDPHHVKGDEGNVAFDLITQYFVEVPKNKKSGAVDLLIRKRGIDRALIFCNTKIMVDLLARRLRDLGLPAKAIHGDMTQAARTKVMAQFKEGTAPYLIATDVAARGIDTYALNTIINYDIPQDVEYYIHRIGRTGRAGANGTSYTLVTDTSDFFSLANVEETTKAPLEEYVLEGVNELPPDTPSSYREHSDKKEKGAGRERGGKPDGGRRPPSAGRVSVLAVDVGTDQDITADDIIKSLITYSNIKKNEIGRITLGPCSSTIEVSPENAQYLMRTLNNATVDDFLVEYTVIKQDISESKPKEHRRPRRRK